jgi:hypothetical protein
VKLDTFDMTKSITLFEIKNFQGIQSTKSARTWKTTRLSTTYTEKLFSSPIFDFRFKFSRPCLFLTTVSILNRKLIMQFSYTTHTISVRTVCSSKLALKLSQRNKSHEINQLLK